MNITKSRIVLGIAMAIRIGLGAIFVYAAWSKLKDPWALFAMAIDSYQVLPLRAVEWVARTLPWVELAIGVLLIAGRWLRVASVITSAMLMVFFGLMVRAYVNGQEINCGCFGPGEALTWKTLLRDGSMLAAALGLTFVTMKTRASGFLAPLTTKL